MAKHRQMLEMKRNIMIYLALSVLATVSEYAQVQSNERRLVIINLFGCLIKDKVTINLKPL